MATAFNPKFINPQESEQQLIARIADAISAGIQSGNNNDAFDVNIVPSATNGFSLGYTFNSSTTAGNNKQTIKTGSGLLGGAVINNTSGTDFYIKVFNDVIANVTLGTTVPVFNFRCQSNANLVIPLMPNGISFVNGLSFAITTGAAALDSTLMSTVNAVIINVIYI